MLGACEKHKVQNEVVVVIQIMVHPLKYYLAVKRLLETACHPFRVLVFRIYFSKISIKKRKWNILKMEWFYYCARSPTAHNRQR